MKLQFFFRQLMLPLKQIESALPKSGLIYEIGCGTGVISAYLSQKSLRRRVVGIDFNPEKIKLARSLYHVNPPSFVVGDGVHFHYISCNGIVLSDFLHHLSYPLQERILKTVSQKLKPGGKLIIKEINKNDGILTILSRNWDLLLYPHDKIYYRNKNDWIRIFENLGFTVKVKREVVWFPGSTFLFICSKN